MKTAMTIAALFVVSSFTAFAAETTPPAPMQMTTAEMDQVVAGAGQQRLRDSTGGQQRDRTRDPEVCGK